MELFNLDTKNKLIIAILVGFGLYFLIMILATIIYVLQWNFLEPEPGSTFEADMMKATLCYIFIPLSIALLTVIIVLFLIKGITSNVCYKNNRKVERKASSIKTNLLCEI